MPNNPRRDKYCRPGRNGVKRGSIPLFTTFPRFADQRSLRLIQHTKAPLARRRVFTDSISMSCAQALSVALKEWAAVCHALETGRQIMLLRKGGIHEAAGEFELDHQEFLLFPTYVHQKLEMIKPADCAGLELRNSEPAEIKISAFASVTDIIQIKSLA